MNCVELFRELGQCGVSIALLMLPVLAVVSIQAVIEFKKMLIEQAKYYKRNEDGYDDEQDRQADWWKKDAK